MDDGGPISTFLVIVISSKPFEVTAITTDLIA